jgi:flavin-dependent dehydrogenase
VPSEVDVLVVGGGPAGSCAATQLARRGYAVVLIDRQRHPRETVGESILPSAWKYFDRLGVSQSVELHGFVKKAGGVVAWDGKITQIAFKDFSYRRPGLHVERAALDSLLLEHARASGVQVVEEVCADAFEALEGSGVRVALSGNSNKLGRSVSTRFLIDASGQNALVAAQLGTRSLDRDFRFISLWGYFADSLYVSQGGIARAFEQIAQHPPMTFVSGLGGWGWAWHIPLRATTSVGIVVPAERYRKDIEGCSSLEEYFLGVCRANTSLAPLLKHATLQPGGVRVMRDFSYRSTQSSGPGYFIIGDAAGFVDPIFSIGYVMALYSGELAAWAIDRSLKRKGQTENSRALFDLQMRSRYELARMMALPGTSAAASGLANSFYDFFSRSEKDLMWSAASMTTRSDNMIRAAGASRTQPHLRLDELSSIQFD